MLKFKFDTGYSLKAFDSVCVCGKETGGLNKAVKFLCKYLVRESGSELVLGIGPNCTFTTIQSKDNPNTVYGTIKSTTSLADNTASNVWRLYKLRNSDKYVLVLLKPHLEYAFIL